MKADFIVVGSGLTGAVLARVLTDNGYSVVVLERRSHVGGNVHDHFHPSGIRIHTYGPHYFRTSSERIWEFVNRYSEFYSYEGIIKSWVDGQYENWPVAASYIRRVLGGNYQAQASVDKSNFETASLTMMPKIVYDKFVKGYTEKQWGVEPKALSADLSRRLEIRDDDDPRLKICKYQGIPVGGYAQFMNNMLKGIPVILNCDYLEYRSQFVPEIMTLYTGPIDQYFDFSLGRLAYRGQEREDRYLPDVDYYYPCGQINNPDPGQGKHIRTLEWKWMMPAQYATKIKGTVLTTETTVNPTNPDNFEYPFPDAQNQSLYRRYREMADAIPNLLICGRLGEYRYFDMDQAIGRATMLAERILTRQPTVEIIRSTESSPANDYIRVFEKPTESHQETAERAGRVR